MAAAQRAVEAGWSLRRGEPRLSHHCRVVPVPARGVDDRVTDPHQPTPQTARREGASGARISVLSRLAKTTGPRRAGRG